MKEVISFRAKREIKQKLEEKVGAGTNLSRYLEKLVESSLYEVFSEDRKLLMIQRSVFLRRNVALLDRMVSKLASSDPNILKDPNVGEVLRSIRSIYAEQMKFNYKDPGS